MMLVAAVGDTISLRFAKSQSASPIRLKPGKKLDAELVAGKPHHYVVRLRAGQYMNIVVEQPIVAMVVRLSPAPGQQLQ